MFVRHVLERKEGAVHSIGPDAPVLEAVRLMSEKHVGALLVMNGQQLVGIVSERDYARKIVLMGRSSSDTPVKTIMSSPVVTVSSDDSLDACMRLVTEKRIRHLPVIERDKVVGVVSIGDIVKNMIHEQRQTIEQLEAYIRS